MRLIIENEIYEVKIDNNETPSNLKVGYVYYLDGEDSFIINYKDYDIFSYESVNIGEIIDKK